MNVILPPTDIKLDMTSFLNVCGVCVLMSIQVEDFVEPNGTISLQREETPSNR